ncbi:uncharacterized protein LOC101863950 [Aplysia californica]|uniref:Uncharacterized protein LOC101863950 n=1 Tax=Aplysia californica TaxID=6500 RepID=A0ABM0KA50_APLCA|nr:uncharacterized protein LOC101863950 [Aplysia californica]
MNNQSHPDTDRLPLPGLLSHQQFVILQNTNAYSAIFFSLLGIGSNFMNIKTFLTMGADDAVTVSFLGLSISDILVSLILLCLGISGCQHANELSQGVLYTYDPFFFLLIFGNAAMAAYTVTMLTTLYIAVARCMCVAKPLHFKHVFTKTRSVIIISAFGVFSTAMVTPVFASLGIVKTFSPVLNGTRYVPWFDVGLEHVKDAVYFVTLVVIPFSTQVIVTVCIIVMTWKLIESSRFRQKSTKEPEFDAIFGRHRYARIYAVCHMMRRVCEQVNSAVNFFIYYSYNTKFRKHCKLLSC